MGFWHENGHVPLASVSGFFISCFILGRGLAGSSRDSTDFTIIQQTANLRLLEAATELHEHSKQTNADSAFAKKLEQFIQRLRQKIGNLSAQSLPVGFHLD
jgi:hypothetical protein